MLAKSFVHQVIINQTLYQRLRRPQPEVYCQFVFQSALWEATVPLWPVSVLMTVLDYLSSLGTFIEVMAVMVVMVMVGTVMSLKTG